MRFVLPSSLKCQRQPPQTTAPTGQRHQHHDAAANPIPHRKTAARALLSSRLPGQARAVVGLSSRCFRRQRLRHWWEELRDGGVPAVAGKPLMPPCRHCASRRSRRLLILRAAARSRGQRSEAVSDAGLGHCGLSARGGAGEKAGRASGHVSPVVLQH